MLGAYLALTESVLEKEIIEAFSKVFNAKKYKLIDLHKLALKKGEESVKK
jgi:Pyruvate/2-oxoacid:ferredoxin oxidoreductase gamma subunit